MADSDASHTAAAAQAASGSANTAARHAPRTKGTAATQAMLELAELDPSPAVGSADCLAFVVAEPLAA